MSLAERLVLPADVREAIVTHAREARPNECCGLIAGRARTASRVFRVPNVADDPPRRYRMEDVSVYRALTAMGEAFEEDADGHVGEPLAIYHSHVSSAPYPSPTDREYAQWPYSFYVLVSLRSGESEVRAYRILNNHPGAEKSVLEVDIVYVKT